jgi:hypothetical protein
MIRNAVQYGLFAAILTGSLAGPAYASSSPGTYVLEWGRKSEQLTYRSCGCADSCWTAELRDRRSKRLKAILRCDCESLLAVYPVKSAERKLHETCDAVNESTDKMKAISETMKILVSTNNVKTRVGQKISQARFIP